MQDGALAEVTTAFWQYAQVLASGDEATRSAFWVHDAAALWADPVGVRDGAGAVEAARGPFATRVVDRLHVRQAADNAAIALAELRLIDGTRGLLTQVWVNTPAGWRIGFAEDVRADSDPIWRIKGTPLVQGASSGPLRGLGVAVKDLFAVAGYRRGAGVPAWLMEAPVEPSSAPAVARLLESGADVVGIAQTDQLAWSLAGANAAYGTPPNAAVPDALPGGSSSGPASAVATGQVDVGLGTDTGGSVRVPASYQGLFGIRPTHGAIAMDGLIPLAPRFDTIGWLARDPDVLRRVGEILLPNVAGAQPITAAILAEDLLALAAPEVAQAVRSAATRLAERAALALTTVPEVTGGSIDAWVNTFRTLQMAQAERCHGDWVRAHPGALGADIAGRFAEARQVTVEDEQAVEDVAEEVGQRLRARIPQGSVLLLPASATPAPPRHQDAQAAAASRLGTLRLTCVSSLAGLPAVVLPTRTAAGAPVGLCAIGAADSDRALLALAQVWSGA